MKKFLVFVLLAIPFLTSAQATPQLQVSKLSADKFEYSAGEKINGSFVLNNIGDIDVPDLQYYIAVGNYGENGGILQNETSATDIGDIEYLRVSEKKVVPFSITPDKIPSGNVGLHVVITQKNGAILGWSKIPLKIAGASSEVVTFEGYLDFDGESFPLLSGPTALKDSTAYVVLFSEDKAIVGMKDFQLTIFDRQFGQNIIVNKTVQAEFIDGLAQIALPTDLNPESYAAQVSMGDNSNIVKFRYIVAGPQAEILSVNSDTLTLKKDDPFTLTLSYTDTPLNLSDPTLTIYPENLSVRLKVANQKGEIVGEYDGKVATGKDNSFAEFDENTDEATLEEASLQIEAALQNKYDFEIPLTAKNSAKNLSFFVELYDPVTGQVFDSYETEFPQEVSSLQNVLLFGGAIIFLLVLIVLFMKTKHKIPTVCVALILTSLFGAHVIIQNAEARIILSSGAGNGDYVFAAPYSSQVQGYDPGATLPVDITYSIWACANNGYLKLHIAIPKLTTWHSFSNPQQALTAIQTDLKGLAGAWWYAQITGQQKGIKKYTDKYHISGTTSNVSTRKFFSYAQNLTAPTTPGMHYMPVAGWYCTSSHGCGAASYVVYEICVNGIGVCPGETVTDYCPNISGTQSSVPAGYEVDGTTGYCEPEVTCNSDHFEGQASCSEVWSCEYDVNAPAGYTGSWVSTPTGGDCSAELNVSCTADPIVVAPNETTTFRSTVQNAVGDIDYTWKNSGGTILGYGQNLSMQYPSIGSYEVSVDVLDNDTSETDSATCRVTVSNCDDSHSGESMCLPSGDEVTWVCTASGWEEQVTGTCAEGLAPVVSKFEFNPNLYTSGRECKLTLEAENVTSCRLYKGGVDAGYTIPLSGPTSINTSGVVGVSVGTYTLGCTGTGDSPTIGFYGTKQCFSDFSVQEGGVTN